MSLPRRRSTAGDTVFRVCLALYIALGIARIQDVIPGLAYLRPGKLLVLPMLVALAVAVPRWQVFAALRTTTAKAVGVVAALALLSIPLSIWPTNSIRFFLTALFPGLVLFLAAAVGFADRRTARVCILILVLSVGADALYMLAGLAPMQKGRPAIGISLDSNLSAALFVATLPFAMTLGSGRERRRWLGLAVSLLLVAAVVKTESRGGAIGLLTVAAILIIRAAPKRRWSYVLAVVACAAAFALTANESSMERFGTILQPRSDYNFTDREGRIQVWMRGLSYMLKRPLFGIGVNGFETAEGVLSGMTNEGFGVSYMAAHNSFIQIGAELGVLGLSAFITALWSAGRGCQRIRQRALTSRDRIDRPWLVDGEATLAATTQAALVGVVVTGFFLSFAYSPITLFALAACVGVQAGSPYASHGHGIADLALLNFQPAEARYSHATSRAATWPT